MEHFTFQLDHRPCAVWIGPGALEHAGALLRRHAPSVRRWAVVSDETVSPLYGTAVLSALAASGLSAALYPVPSGEGSKTPEAWLSLCRRLLADGFQRDCGIAALGGGSCGDAAGFAAATLLRGVTLVHLPTTLLAQADSAIGGKAALDLPEGKNLLGAFHQPAAVLIDPLCLATLPPRQFASGMAEVIKTGCVADGTLLTLAERGLSPADTTALTDALLRCTRAKASLTQRDPFDHDMRRLLNFGHTYGHAYEAAGGYTRYTHGEAVAAGMCRTLRYQASHGCGGILLPRLEELLARYSLPTAAAETDEALRPWLTRDKKTSGSHITLAIAERPGAGRLLTVPLESLWEETT